MAVMGEGPLNTRPRAHLSVTSSSRLQNMICCLFLVSASTPALINVAWLPWLKVGFTVTAVTDKVTLSKHVR